MATDEETYLIYVSGYNLNALGDFELEILVDNICDNNESQNIAPVDASSADILWSSENAGATYEIEYGVSGFTLGDGTSMSV
ncbi:MAG: hypothetical protein HRT72_07605 [Flavobacteriales bacterium]|nr:hypothetical protein [Flavobacteriales bacterium]